MYRIVSKCRRLCPRRGWSIWLVGLFVLLAACDGTSDGPGPDGPVGPVGPVSGNEEGIPGSGETTTERRELAEFDRVVFSSEGTVVLSQDETVSLSIEADDNLHQYLVAEVANGELTISTTENTDIAPSRPIVFRVAMVNPARIELAGAGDISASALESSTLEVALTGTGDITIDQLQATEVRVTFTGVGVIRLTGQADHQNVVASGVGDYDGADLVSRTAAVEASGLGTATINVSDELRVTVADSGAVSFYGSPVVEESVSDTGTVTPLGAR